MLPVPPGAFGVGASRPSSSSTSVTTGSVSGCTARVARSCPSRFPTPSAQSSRVHGRAESRNPSDYPALSRRSEPAARSAGTARSRASSGRTAQSGSRPTAMHRWWYRCLENAGVVAHGRYGRLADARVTTHGDHRVPALLVGISSSHSSLRDPHSIQTTADIYGHLDDVDLERALAQMDSLSVTADNHSARHQLFPPACGGETSIALANDGGGGNRTRVVSSRRPTGDRIRIPWRLSGGPRIAPGRGSENLSVSGTGGNGEHVAREMSGSARLARCPFAPPRSADF